MASSEMDITTAIKKRLGRSSNSSLITAGPVLKTGIQALDAACSKAPVRAGSLIDIVGYSRSGKTRLLHLIAAYALTNGVMGSKCYWYDLNDGLDINFLCELIKQRMNDVELNINKILKRLHVFKVENSSELWKSLYSFPVDIHECIIIIDALGIFHYKDKYDSDLLIKSGELLSIEIKITNAIKQILLTRTVVIYTSKCSLYDGEKLGNLIIKWPFKNAGIPDIPKDIMPEAWNRLVTHIILLYDIQNTVNNDQCSSKKGIVCMSFQQHGNNKNKRLLCVCSASVLNICKDDVICDLNHTHIV